jgi:hypothetical protein
MEVRRAATLTLMTCALARPAHADTESIALDYRASTGCPGRERFVEQVRALTTKAELVEADPALRQFRVEAERKGNSVTGRLSIIKDGESSEREVKGKTCGEVVSALALATAIAVDPSVLGGEPEPKEPKEEPPPPPKPPLAKPEEDRKPEPRPESPPPTSKAVLSFGYGVMTAITPDFAGRFALRIGFKPGFALAPEVFIEGGYVPPVESKNATFSAALGRAGATWEFLDLQAVALGLYSSLELGVLNAVGADTIRRPQTDDSLWGAADLGLSLRVPASTSLFFRVEVGGFVTFYRHEYLIATPMNTPEDVHAIDAYGFRGSGFVGFFL